MADVDPLKLDSVTELRDLAAQAATVFDNINVLLIKMDRYGFIDAEGKTPDAPILDSDLIGAHEGLTSAQLYGVVQWFGGLVQSVDRDTAKLIARFGRLKAQQ